MQTVNFRCGHCNNLMAVGTEFLGQQVRCPTCQNVVVAPAAASPEPVPAPMPAPKQPEPESMFPTLAETEDIFSEKKEPTDSLFDELPQHRLDLSPPPKATPEPPPEPAPAPTLFLEPMVAHLPAAFEQEEPTLSFMPATESVPSNGSLPLTDTVSAPWMSSPSDNGQAASSASPVSFAEPTKRREPKPAKINWFLPLVFLPLLLYAVLATVAVAILYLRMASAPPTLFDQMPDTQGDTPGTRPGKAKGQGQVINFDQKFASLPLPEHLKVALGSPLVVGDLEVTPTKLERGHFAMFNEKAPDKAEPGQYEALKLHLRLKNLATDYAFTPMDNFFDRKYVPGKATPLTLLQAGATTFYGGPANWFPLNRDKNRGTSREWLNGRKNVDYEGLQPGETAETIVCTDGWDSAVQLHLFGTNKDGETTAKPYAGNLEWRIQLRRGLITHKGRRLPAACVIGVEFTFPADLPAETVREDS